MKIKTLAACIAVAGVVGIVALAVAGPPMLRLDSAATATAGKPLSPAEDRRRLFDERRERFAGAHR